MAAAIAPEMSWLPSADVPLADAAVLYASHTFRVIPVWNVAKCAPTKADARCGCGKDGCDGPGKHPIPRAWQKKATTDVDEVRDARRSHPTANIGIALGGPDRLIAIDIDGDAGRRSWQELEARYGPAPATLSARSGRSDGGQHRIYRVPEYLDLARIKNRASTNGLKGIDTRGNNGQIVVPPSVHYTGQKYEWCDFLPIATIPDAYFEAIAEAPERPSTKQRTFSPNVYPIGDAYVRKVIENAARDIASRPEGERNSVLFAKACTCFEYCLGQNINDRDAWRALFDAGLACGLKKGEVEQTLHNAKKRAAKNPRYVPEPKTQIRPPVRHDADGVIDDDTPLQEPPEDVDADIRDRQWESELTRNQEGNIKNTFGNICKILRCAPEYGDKLTFHEMRVSPIWNGQPMRDADIGKIREHIEEQWRFPPGQQNVVDAVLTVSSERSFHPVRKYLTELKPDGDPWIVRILPHVFGITNPDPLQQRMLRCWFISAVARAMTPGCKVDTALVLVGKQGFRKSTFFSTLAGEWFADSRMEITNKDGVLQLHSAWLYEWAEIENVTSTKQASEVKGFITTARDTLRLPFGRAVVVQPRSSIIVGSTNEAQFLNDPTGSRRFWIIFVERKLNFAWLAEHRDQLWAEAVAAHAAGETWWLSDEEDTRREQEAEDYRLDDAWEPPIQEWVSKREANPTKSGTGFTTYEVMVDALKLTANQQSPTTQGRVGKCLRRLGYDNKREWQGTSFVRVWKKVHDWQGRKAPGPGSTGNSLPLGSE